MHYTNTPEGRVRPLLTIALLVIGGCNAIPRPGAGGQCGVEDPRPGQHIDKPLMGCLIFDWDAPRPFWPHGVNA